MALFLVFLGILILLGVIPAKAHRRQLKERNIEITIKLNSLFRHREREARGDPEAAEETTVRIL